MTLVYLYYQGTKKWVKTPQNNQTWQLKLGAPYLLVLSQPKDFWTQIYPRAKYKQSSIFAASRYAMRSHTDDCIVPPARVRFNLLIIYVTHEIVHYLCLRYSCYKTFTNGLTNKTFKYSGGSYRALSMGIWKHWNYQSSWILCSELHCNLTGRRFFTTSNDGVKDNSYRKIWKEDIDEL